MVKVLVDEGYRLAVIQGLREARVNIRIMMFRIQRRLGYGKTEGNIYGFWMKKKVTQGTRVRLLLDISRRPGVPYKENFLFARELTDAGVECRELKNSRVCHAKVVIIDERIMIVGSHNWTQNSTKRNLEVSLRVQDNFAVKGMAENFDRIFEKAAVFS